ncbi:MAG: lipopolysaccharide heptosyltransferase II [Verrucomicrobiota bacterium]
MPSEVAIEELGHNLLLRSPNWLGDAVMTLPAVQQLISSASKSTRISVLAPPKLCDFWACIGSLDQVIPVDKNPFITGYQLRSHQFTSALIFPNSPRTALEPFFACIPKRYGFHGSSRKMIMTKSWSKDLPARGLRHQMFDYLQLVKHLGATVENNGNLPSLSKPQNPMPEHDYITICPGAEYGPTKRWKADRFSEVSDHFAKHYNLKVVLLGAEIDEEAAHHVRRHMSDKESILDLTGKTSMSDFVAWIAHSTFIVCNDSGAMHIAAAFQRPGVAIFGSTEPRLTGPIANSIRVIRNHVPCSPCFLRECPLDFRCMERLYSDEVIKIAEEHFASFN